MELQLLNSALGAARKTCAVMSGAALVFGFAASAQATAIVSVDRATFAAAVDGGDIAGEDFEDIAAGTLLPSLNGVTFDASEGDVIVTADFLTTTFPNGIGSTSSLQINPDIGAFFLDTETVTLTFDAAITAFAIDINTFADTEGAYSATLSTGEVVTSIFEVFPDSDTGQFLGFVADTAFTSITIAAISGFSYTLDSLVFGDAAAVVNPGDVFGSEVPLPAALPLMLAGLGGLGFASRRRRATH